MPSKAKRVNPALVLGRKNTEAIWQFLKLEQGLHEQTIAKLEQAERELAQSKQGEFHADTARRAAESRLAMLEAQRDAAALLKAGQA